MVVLDGIVKSKALVCLVFSNFLLVLAQRSSLPVGARSNRAIGGHIADEDKILKTNRQITVVLPRKEFNVFQYLDVETQEHSLSIVVTPCSTPVKWSLVYSTFDEVKKRNITASLEDVGQGNSSSNSNSSGDDGDGVGGTYEISSAKTVTMVQAKRGSYFVIFHPLADDARVTVYVTMDEGGPYEMTIPQRSNIVLTPQRRQRLKVTWDQSLVNPQNTSYCLVVNTRRDYPYLCSAQDDGPVIKGADARVIVNMSKLKLEKRRRKAKFAKIDGGMKFNNDTLIVCVDRKVQLTFTKLRKGIKYYFNLFAINNKTNLTIPYGQSSIEYNYTVKPMTLRDGVKKLVDLKKSEGKALFRYKVNSSVRELYFYVLVCGGAVDVDVKQKGPVKRRGKKAKEPGKRLLEQTRVFEYKRFVIYYPTEGDQYFLKVTAPNIDELTRIKYVEVLMTAYPARRYPLPLLPDDPTLYEFKSQRTCTSVTIGWIPVVDSSVNTYCVVVWENRKYDYADLFRGHFQCNLDEPPRRRSFASSPPAEASVTRDCEDMVVTEKSVTNYKIRDLKPGTSYTIQVTVKKKKGRTLSYKFLKVYTKHSCKY